MTSIANTVEIKAPTGAVYEVLSTLGGLRSWWSTDMHGNPEKGGELRIGFGEERSSLMKAEDAKKNKSLRLKVVSSTFPEGKDWVGTIISFTIAESNDRGTLVTFSHTNWKEGSKSFERCEKQWGLALTSLKGLCETGKGKPEIPKKKQTKKATGWFPIS